MKSKVTVTLTLDRDEAVYLRRLLGNMSRQQWRDNLGEGEEPHGLGESCIESIYNGLPDVDGD